jgi:hypothetical protein
MERLQDSFARFSAWLEENGERSGYQGPADEVVDEIHTYIESKDYEPGRDEWEHLIGLCDKALAMDPDCYTAFVVKGKYHFDRSEYDMMETNFIKALEVVDDPSNGYTGTWPSYMMVTLTDGMAANEGQIDQSILGRVMERQFEAYVRRDRRLLRDNPSFSVLKRLTKAFLDNGLEQDALREIDQYILRCPKDKRASKLRKKVEALAE